MPKTKSNKTARVRLTNSIKQKRIFGIVGVLLFAVIGATIVAMSSAQDPSTISANIIKTQYAYPSNAIFASPSGNDGAAGTLQAPVKTLQAAINKTSAGGTVVMRAGVYREAINTIAKAITIQPYPNEEVWLDGSDPVTGWVQEGSVWRKDGWTAAATLCPNNGCFEQLYIADENKAAGLPDMLFVNGTQLKQVLTRAEVVGNTFYVDRANSTIHMGVNPSGKTVEASTRKRAIMYYSSATAGSKLRGIGIRRYASNLTFASSPAQVEVSNGARGIEFENLVFTESSTNGLFLGGDSTNRATGLVVRSSVFIRNGASGISGNYTDGLLLDNNIVHDNNTEKAQWEGVYGTFGGVKISRMTNSTIKNNVFQNNFGTGFWCDLDCRSNRMVGNMSRFNTNNGLYYEISSGGIVASNVIYGNGAHGIKASGQEIKIYNNTVYNNVADNVFVYNDGRESSPGRTLSENIDIKNNIIAGGPRTGTGTRLLATRMDPGIPAQVIIGLDNNLYYRPNNTLPKTVLSWRGAGVNTEYSTFNATLQSQTGRESKGMLVEGQSIDVIFKNASSGDFKLASKSAAIASGAALPADVAAALDMPAGQIVNRGALVWRSGVGVGLATSDPDPVIPPTPPANKPPVAQISLSGTSFDAPANFTVSATGTDADGSIVRIEILQNDAVVQTCYSAASCQFVASSYQAGTYRYSSRVYDNASPSLSATSSIHTVVIKAPAQPPVVVPAPTPAPAKVSGVRAGVEQGFLTYNMGLAWTASAGATEYQITPVGRAPKIAKNANFSDPNITKDTVYTYELVARNAAGESPKTTIKAQMRCTWWVLNCSAQILSVQ